jgi:Ferritin-like domain
MASAAKGRAKSPASSASRDSTMGRVMSDPVSRRKFIGVGGGSAATAAFLAACGGGGSSSSSTTTQSSAAIPPPPEAMFGKGDLGILNYALTLEYLETAFYADVVKSGLFKGSSLATIRKFGDEEAQHVAALTAAIKQSGGTPATAPKTKFPLDNANSVLMLAATVENLGAAAYLGQAGNIQSADVLASALAIHTVEGRHAAALNTLLGETIVPDGAFAKPADPTTVLNSVQPFIVS